MSYRGSANTKALVKDQIIKRFGLSEAENYDPSSNCLTLRSWNALGYRVKKGEHALKSFTFVGENEGENKRRWRKSVYLFYHLQVEPSGNAEQLSA